MTFTIEQLSTVPSFVLVRMVVSEELSRTYRKTSALYIGWDKNETIAQFI